MGNIHSSERKMTDRDIQVQFGPDLGFDFDYVAQLEAIYDLHIRFKNRRYDLRTQRESVAESEAHRHSGIITLESEYKREVVKASEYEDVALSLAVTGVIAPFIESVFRAYCRQRGKPLPQKNNLREDIMKFVNNTDNGIKRYMPKDLCTTLDALFIYRNKALHYGFEWPPDQRRKFSTNVSNWPSGWFRKITSGDDTRMFYMSPEFADICVDTAVAVLTGISRYNVRIHAPPEKGPFLNAL